MHCLIRKGMRESIELEGSYDILSSPLSLLAARYAIAGHRTSLEPQIQDNTMQRSAMGKEFNDN